MVFQQGCYRTLIVPVICHCAYVGAGKVNKKGKQVIEESGRPAHDTRKRQYSFLVNLHLYLWHVLEALDPAHSGVCCIHVAARHQSLIDKHRFPCTRQKTVLCDPPSIG